MEYDTFDDNVSLFNHIRDYFKEDTVTQQCTIYEMRKHLWMDYAPVDEYPIVGIDRHIRIVKSDTSNVLLSLVITREHRIHGIVTSFVCGSARTYLSIDILTKKTFGDFTRIYTLSSREQIYLSRYLVDEADYELHL